VLRLAKRCAGVTEVGKRNAYIVPGKSGRIRQHIYGVKAEILKKGYGSESREKCIQLGYVRCSDGGPLLRRAYIPIPLAHWNSAIMTPKRSLRTKEALKRSDDSRSVQAPLQRGERVLSLGKQCSDGEYPMN
jgi:hypothetical protein